MDTRRLKWRRYLHNTAAAENLSQFTLRNAAHSGDDYQLKQTRRRCSR
jgi:hypothetical protein